MVQTARSFAVGLLVPRAFIWGKAAKGAKGLIISQKNIQNFTPIRFTNRKYFGIDLKGLSAMLNSNLFPIYNIGFMDPYKF